MQIKIEDGFVPFSDNGLNNDGQETSSENLINTQNPFKSFWMGGFECTDQLNAFGNRVDFLNITGHLQNPDHDYKLLSTFNIKTVREGIRWSQVEKTPYTYDWSSVHRLMLSAKANQVQQVWDICHFGFPDDLTPLHPLFPRRFAALCKAFVEFYRSVDRVSTLIVTPINEVSFLSWLGGDVRGTSPFCVGQGWEVKYRLMKAYIEGVEALKEADPGVRILTTEPLVNIVPVKNASPEQIAHAAGQNDFQFQVTDILAGRICPELRGKPEYLDILGFNYYYNNQYVQFPYEVLGWVNEPEDDRFIYLHDLIEIAFRRYNRPVILSETSHPAEDRPSWISHIAEQCSKVLNKDIPFWGICWYPVVDRPDWDHLHIWHQSGIWDAKLSDGRMIDKVLHTPSALALLEAQQLLNNLRRLAPIVAPVVNKGKMRQASKFKAGI